MSGRGADHGGTWRPAQLLFLARRSLGHSRLTFALLVLAVAAGSGFQIPNTANLAGFRTSILDNELRHGSADVRVSPSSGACFADGIADAAEVRRIAGTGQAIPILTFPGAVMRGPTTLATTVQGVDPGGAFHPYHIIRGAALTPGDSTGLLLGSSLARQLGAEPGDTIEVRVLFSPLTGSIGTENTGRYRMTVRGIVVGGAGSYRSAFVDRGFLSAELGAPGVASSVLLLLGDKEHDSAQAVAERITAGFPETKAMAWMDDSAYLPNYLQANRVINKVSSAMVIAAVSIPVWALLYIHVLNRKREIGILVALGFRRREIFVLFLLQSFVVACIGFAVGAVLGYGVTAYFDAHPVFQWEGMIVKPVLSPAGFLLPCLIVVATTILAGVIPALRAARVDPARTLRGVD